jgi:hypothetical protein
MLRNEVSLLESSLASGKKSSDDRNRFNSLIGLYEVSSVITNNKKENPVGGKWTRSDGMAQKLFKTRKTYQHILPYNTTGLARYDGEIAVAEAINVVSLDGLNGLLRATIILRGDVVPLSPQELKVMNSKRTTNLLSNLSVRVNFDAPRIFFGKRLPGRQNAFKYLPLQLGPVSDVVLDTSFCDEFVRIGVGGTSGTRFIFKKTADDEAKEYEGLLQQSPAKKLKLLGVMTSVLAGSVYIALMSPSFLAESTSLALVPSLNVVKSIAGGLIRLLAGTIGLVAGIGTLLIAFSSGGIERDGVQANAA